MPKISVIVPVYKVEDYLCRCIDSILAQTYSDYEVILVDDGSPDNCGAICDTFAERDLRIHVIHQENKGCAASRNAGIDWVFRNSDSRWIAFIDSDDWVHPDYLKTLYQTADEQGVNLSVCNYLYTQSFQEYLPVRGGSQVFDWESFFMQYTLQAIVPWNKLYARELFEKTRYPAESYNEDEFVAHILLHNAGRLSYFSEPLYYYYQNPKGIMNSPYSQKRLDQIRGLSNRLEFARRNGSREFLRFCLYYFCEGCIYHSKIVRESKGLDESTRNRFQSFFRNEMRKKLIKYGPGYIPVRSGRKYYSFAFPTAAAVVRTFYSLLKKLREKLP